MSIFNCQFVRFIPLQVGVIAINDGIILRTHISRILKTHFKKSPIYVELNDLFNDVRYSLAPMYRIGFIYLLHFLFRLCLLLGLQPFLILGLDTCSELAI